VSNPLDHLDNDYADGNEGYRARAGPFRAVLAPPLKRAKTQKSRLRQIASRNHSALLSIYPSKHPHGICTHPAPQRLRLLPPEMWTYSWPSWVLAPGTFSLVSWHFVHMFSIDLDLSGVTFHTCRLCCRGCSCVPLSLWYPDLFLVSPHHLSPVQGCSDSLGVHVTHGFRAFLRVSGGYPVFYGQSPFPSPTVHTHFLRLVYPF